MTGQESVDLPREERDGTPGLARLEYTRKLLAHWFALYNHDYIYTVTPPPCDRQRFIPQIVLLWDTSQGQYRPKRATFC
jgi:hypothetical protein